MLPSHTTTELDILPLSYERGMVCFSITSIHYQISRKLFIFVCQKALLIINLLTCSHPKNGRNINSKPSMMQFGKQLIYRYVGAVNHISCLVMQYTVYLLGSSDTHLDLENDGNLI